MRGWKLAGVGMVVGALVLTGCGGDGGENQKQTPTGSASPSAQSDFPRSGSQRYAEGYAMAADLRKAGSPCETFEYINYKPGDSEINVLCGFKNPGNSSVMFHIYSTAMEAWDGAFGRLPLGPESYFLYGGGNWRVECEGQSAGARSACEAAQKVFGGTLYRWPANSGFPPRPTS